MTTSAIKDRADERADFPPRTSVPYELHYLARLMTADFVERTAGTDIAPGQAFVMRELWREEPLSQVEISERLDIGKATVGQSLKRLERNGLIERRRSGQDARVLLVHLTDKGRTARSQMVRAAHEQVDAITQVLGERNAALLGDLLVKLIEDLQARLSRTRI